MYSRNVAAPILLASLSLLYGCASNPSEAVYANGSSYCIDKLTVIFDEKSKVAEYKNEQAVANGIQAELKNKLMEKGIYSCEGDTNLINGEINYSRIWSLSGALIFNNASINGVSQKTEINISKKGDNTHSFIVESAKKFGGVKGYFKTLKSTFGVLNSEDEDVFIDDIGSSIADRLN